jgi:hypothetical protein
MLKFCFTANLVTFRPVFLVEVLAANANLSIDLVVVKPQDIFVDFCMEKISRSRGDTLETW